MTTITKRPDLRPDVDEQRVELTRDVATVEAEVELEADCDYCGYALDSDGWCVFCGATALTRPEPR